MTTVLILVAAALAIPLYFYAWLILIRRLLAGWFMPTDRAAGELLPRYRAVQSPPRSLQQPHRAPRWSGDEMVSSANESPVDFENQRRLLDDHFWWGTGRWEPTSTDSLLDSSPFQFGGDDTFQSTQLSSSFDQNSDGSTY